MKPILLLSFLSLSLLIQFINCEGDLTFSLILDKFYEKASEEGVTIKKPQLDFVLNIASDINEIQNKFQVSAMDTVPKMRKMPNTFKMKQKSDGIKDMINLAIGDELVKIRNIYVDILEAIVYKPAIKYDQVLENWLTLWSRDPMDKEHVKNVNGQISKMKKLVGKVQEKFNKEIKVFD
ncbi:uncharacterized protein LOC116352012 [Contarinia nasturtii]|uniref:uncharacterized protein LOC116352012 n=1 Tax=Contarinia nasturtii TaxID=265458 RepID=UPI0012D3E706|nr:uncharacterized protein LOC116352012 [Contarinia nasturtii]